MPEKASFVEIVRSMVDEGHDLPAIVETLETLGLSRADAEKLVGIMVNKTVPHAQQSIDLLVKKKVLSEAAARQIRLERRAISSKRQKTRKWNRMFSLSDSLLREFAPGKHLAFKQRWRNLAAAREAEYEARKQLQALLLEVEGKNLPYRAEAKLKKAIELLELE
jgi:hypothetical protein